MAADSSTYADEALAARAELKCPKFGWEFDAPRLGCSEGCGIAGCLACCKPPCPTESRSHPAAYGCLTDFATSVEEV